MERELRLARPSVHFKPYLVVAATKHPKLILGRYPWLNGIPGQTTLALDPPQPGNLNPGVDWSNFKPELRLVKLSPIGFIGHEANPDELPAGGVEGMGKYPDPLIPSGRVYLGRSRRRKEAEAHQGQAR